MKRRSFVKKGAALSGAAVAAAATTSTFPTPAISQGLKEWKMVMSWPLNAPGSGTQAQAIARRIETMSGGKIKIKVYGGGELVPPFGVFDAVSAGDADIYHSAEYYYQGKDKAFNFFTAVPYGLTANEHSSWILYGGGQQLWDELSADFNLKPFMAASTGCQMGGWYRKPINSVEDLKGLKFRMPGIGGEVLRTFGVTVVNLPVAEIYPALASGAIDASEWVGPWQDMAFGFYKIAKNYYWPGFHEPGTTAACVINKKVWDGLNKEEQLIVQSAIESVAYTNFAEATARNIESLSVLLEKHGVQMQRYSDEMLIEFGKASGQVVSEMAQSSPMAKKVYASFIDYRKKSIGWAKIGEQAFMNARGLPFKYA